MLPMNFLRRLTLDLNTWCISVEEEAGYIIITRISDAFFDIDRGDLDIIHMPLPAILHPGTPAP